MQKTGYVIGETNHEKSEMVHHDNTTGATLIDGGSYTSVHVSLKLLNKLRKKDKMQGFGLHLIIFPQQD